MKKIFMISLVSIFSIIFSANSLTLHAPAGSVWVGPGGATMEKGIVTYVGIHYLDPYNGIADAVTIGCDPDVLFCWEITNDGKDLEIWCNGIVNNPTDSTKYYTITTNQ